MQALPRTLFQTKRTLFSPEFYNVLVSTHKLLPSLSLDNLVCRFSANSESQEGSVKLQRGLGWLNGPEARRLKFVEDEWEELKDEATGRLYYQSVISGETTEPGFPKPDTWTELVDKEKGLIYYWNRRTGETTAVGEAKPGPYGRHSNPTDQDNIFRQIKEEDSKSSSSSLSRFRKVAVNVLAILGGLFVFVMYLQE